MSSFVDSKETATSTSRVTSHDVIKSPATTTAATSVQLLPSPLPSPPPHQLSSSSSSPSSSLSSSSTSLVGVANHKQQQRIDTNSLVITHSTPPQSPFMLDDKQQQLHHHQQTSLSPPNTTIPTPITTAPATTTTSATTSSSNTTSNNPEVVEAHTPPESNDGTETQIRLTQLNNKLSHFNSLNSTFQHDRSLEDALDASRRRVRAIHVASFNRHVADYLKRRENSSQTDDDQVVGDEIAYELARRRDDEDDDGDVDETITSSSSSSSEDEANDDDDDQLISDGERSRGLENDFYFRTTGDVNLRGPTTNGLNADDYWSIQRVRLGGEWQRVQAKMKYLKHTNEQLDKYMSSEREIEKLSRSLKQSIKQTFSTSSTGSLIEFDDDDDEKDDELVIDTHERMTSTSRRVLSSRHRNRFTCPRTYSFDELALLKSFYITLMHFRTSLFKHTCICDGERQRQKRPVSLLDKSCLFCHMFKKYDSSLFIQDTDTGGCCDRVPTTAYTTNRDDSNTQFIRADERVIRLYHSYCKQPKYSDKLNWSSKPPQPQPQPQPPAKLEGKVREAQLDDEYESIDQELSRLVCERLNKLLDRHKERHESVSSIDTSLGEIGDIDPGYEISLDDIKKLPDFSYDELKFLCEDLRDDADSGNKRKELDSDESSSSSSSKRIRLSH